MLLFFGTVCVQQKHFCKNLIANFCAKFKTSR